MPYVGDFYRVRYLFLLTLLELDRVPAAPASDDAKGDDEAEDKAEENTKELVPSEMPKHNCEAGNFSKM